MIRGVHEPRFDCIQILKKAVSLTTTVHHFDWPRLSSVSPPPPSDLSDHFLTIPFPAYDNYYWRPKMGQFSQISCPAFLLPQTGLCSLISFHRYGWPPSLQTWLYRSTTSSLYSLWPWTWRQHVSPKYQCPPTRLHSTPVYTVTVWTVIATKLQNLHHKIFVAKLQQIFCGSMCHLLKKEREKWKSETECKYYIYSVVMKHCFHRNFTPWQKINLKSYLCKSNTFYQNVIGDETRWASTLW
jgi:hypothetical protein